MRAYRKGGEEPMGWGVGAEGFGGIGAQNPAKCIEIFSLGKLGGRLLGSQGLLFGDQSF